MEKQTRRIGNMIFEKAGESYYFAFSKRHIIQIRKRDNRGWIAKERILAGKGKYRDGEKVWETIRASTGENLEDALSGILESM